MADEDWSEREYFDAQLSEIHRRISARTVRQRRRKMWLIAAGSVTASLAITGGAVMAIQATDTEKTGSVCYSRPSLSSRTIEAGEAPENGTPGPLPGMDERVAGAEEQCALAWQVGAFEPGGVQDDPQYPAPPLFTCVLRDGRLGVFPDDGKTTCLQLGLPDPLATPPR
ncbi:hypothetical protein [Microbacterium luticocti]|uniref:hypothetical protein n=1 Tax=Microbacterium luticocti TaxID=451764 RepID=UPI0012EBA3F7|nr:hypothetical protein [Microbacterium luticocti]